MPEVSFTEMPEVSQSSVLFPPTAMLGSGGIKIVTFDSFKNNYILTSFIYGQGLFFRFLLYINY